VPGQKNCPTALVRALGEDRVQMIIDEAFTAADFRPMHAEVV
jgi:hypothetical protein